MLKALISIAQQDAKLFRELVDSTDLAEIMEQHTPAADPNKPVLFSLDVWPGTSINYFHLGMAWKEAMQERAGVGVYPEALTPELDEVLGWPNFKCGGFADAFRAAGFAIPRKAEREQAFVLHWLIKLVMKHGADWQTFARAELQRMHDEVDHKQEPT